MPCPCGGIFYGDGKGAKGTASAGGSSAPSSASQVAAGATAAVLAELLAALSIGGDLSQAVAKEQAVLRPLVEEEPDDKEKWILADKAHKEAIRLVERHRSDIHVFSESICSQERKLEASRAKLVESTEGLAGAEDILANTAANIKELTSGKLKGTAKEPGAAGSAAAVREDVVMLEQQVQSVDATFEEEKRRSEGEHKRRKSALSEKLKLAEALGAAQEAARVASEKAQAIAFTGGESPQVEEGTAGARAQG